MPGVACKDDGISDSESLCDRSHACFAKKAYEKLNLELFRNVSVHKFCRLKALITLEQVSGGKKFEKIVMLGYEGPFWSKLHD